jgi:DNA-binding transcriptional MerR regulator
MHSGELARLAGVTVRALRHYHQVGVLAEPERRRNGYRSYDVHDLIRVLRIKRLAALGVRLERMPALLDDAGDDVEALLDDLDRDLADQLENLTRQRELVARLRALRTAPDLPPELAPFLAAFAPRLSPELARYDRDQSVLLAHLVGDEGLPDLARFYERVSGADLAPSLADFADRFAHLGPGSPEAEISALVDDFAALVEPLIEEFSAATQPTGLDGTAGLFTQYAADALNEQQLEALARLERLLVASHPASG